MSSINNLSSKELEDLSLKYDYPSWLVSRYSKYVPNLQLFLECMTREEPRRYIRTNYIKISSDNLRERLSSKGFILETTNLAEVFLIKNNPYPIGATTEYLLGYYYIQDLSSCFTVDALDLSNNLLVLDMASSPGGKTTFIAQRMNNTGCILAVEPNPHRLKRLFYNIERCGVANTSIWNIDGKNILDYGLKFDRVLLDAPCSCDGIIQKEKSRKTTYVKESITHCSLKQNKLLEVAVEVTKPGGLVVYSTCSLAPEENEFIVNSVLSKYDIRLEDISFGVDGLTQFETMNLDSSLNLTKRFYPHMHNTSGFFIAKLRRIS